MLRHFASGTRFLITHKLPDARIRQLVCYSMAIDSTRGIYLAPWPDTPQPEWIFYFWDDETVKFQRIDENGEVELLYEPGS
jgi:hypothetical protein